MTPAVISILTNGLNCGATDACYGGSVLNSGPFTLFCTDVMLVPGGMHGGGTPTNAGPIGNYGWAEPTLPSLNQPQTQQGEESLVFIDPSRFLGDKAPVKITFKMGKINVEREYMVDAKKRTVMIKIIKLVNTTTIKAKLTVVNLRKRARGITVRIKNRKFFRKDQ